MKEDSNDSELIQLTTLKLTGESSPDDLSRLNELLALDGSNQELHDELVRTWEGTETVKGFTQVETNQEWSRLQKALHDSNKQNSLPFLRIAASITLLIGVGLLVFFLTRSDDVTILAQQIQTEVLADGSSVTLNASSELNYSPSFGEQSREVTLKGEAYFDIERDEEKPFIIYTSSFDIKVLGTSFNVQTLENKSTAEVVVITGSVEVSYGGNSIILEVGEKGILNKKTGQLFKTFNNDVNFQAWRTKKFTFNDVPLDKVIELLNNAYQTKLYITGTEIQKCPVTVSFENQSLTSILEVLKVTLDLTINDTNQGVEISGRGC